MTDLGKYLVKISDKSHVAGFESFSVITGHALKQDIIFFRDPICFGRESQIHYYWFLLQTPVDVGETPFTSRWFSPCFIVIVLNQLKEIELINKRPLELRQKTHIFVGPVTRVFG
jgi:hypothetical protein